MLLTHVLTHEAVLVVPTLPVEREKSPAGPKAAGLWSREDVEKWAKKRSKK